MNSRAQSDGYALPAVLAVLSMLSLVFVTAIAAVNSLTRDARQAIDAVEFERQALSAEAHAAFIATTEPIGQDQLRIGATRISPLEEMGGPPTPTAQLISRTPLYLDDRPYRWTPRGTARFGQLAISLQDTAGLMNLDFSRRDSLVRMFLSVGIGASDSEVLADELLDYIDADSFRRPEGAEAEEYRLAGRAPPPNAPLRRVQDVFGLLHWRESVNAAAWQKLAPMIVVDPSRIAFNVNTAPAEVLEAVLNMSAERARAVVAQRRIAPIVSLDQIGIASSDTLNTYTFPNGRIRVTVRDPKHKATYSSMLVLTPESRERPLWIEDTTVAQLPRSNNLPVDPDAPPFPDPFR